MGIGDSIGKAAENAMEDLAGTSKKSDDAHAPEPGSEADDIQVHSSISEGSNAMDDDGDASPGGGTGGTAYTPQGPGAEASGGSGTASGVNEADAPDAPRDVAGPAGLPDPDPDGLRADPSEGDQDPSTGMGRS